MVPIDRVSKNGAQRGKATLRPIFRIYPLTALACDRAAFSMIKFS